MLVNKCVGIIFVSVFCMVFCQDLDIVMVGEVCDNEIVQNVV